MGLFSGGLFFYKSYLTGQKKVLSDSLQRARATFEQDTINELELFDKRVSASKQVLNNHIVLSPMFALLGNLTIPSIQYTKFDHETTDKGFFVNISGIATDYRSIALQADAFNGAKGRSFKNVVFSNLTKDKNNHIVFDLNFTVDPSLLSYEKDTALEQAQAQTDGSSTSSTTTAPPTTTGVTGTTGTVTTGGSVNPTPMPPTSGGTTNNNQTH